MKNNYKTIRELPVVTEGGEKLGKVVDLEVDGEAFSVDKFVVSSGKLIGKREYLIGAEQIVRITENEIVVMNSSIKQEVGVDKLTEKIPVKESAGINFKTE